MYLKTMLMFDSSGAYVRVVDVETYDDIHVIRNAAAMTNDELRRSIEYTLKARFMFAERGGEQYFVKD